MKTAVKLTVLFVFSFIFAQNCLAADRTLIVIDLDDTLRTAGSVRALNKSEIKIVRKSMTDSILIISPVMGTSTCIFILKEKDLIENYENRIAHNCAAQSEINLTGILDARYAIEFSSCHTGIEVCVTIVTIE